MSEARLRVAIDAHDLSLAEGTGIATYTRTLESALTGMGAEVHALYGMPVAPGGCPPEVAFFDGFREGRPRSRLGRLKRLVGVARRGIWHGWRPVAPSPVPDSGFVDRRQVAHRLPRAATLHNAPRMVEVANLRFLLRGGFHPIRLTAPVDVFHATHPLPLRMEGVANVCTIHDLIPLTLPFTTLDRKAAYFRLLRRITHQFDMLFAVSDHTRREVMRLFGVPDDRICVTYQSIEIDPTDETEESAAGLVASAFGLPHRGYLLFVGAVEPKKNLHRLLEAYLSSGLELPLVIAGPEGWLVKEQTQLLTSGALRGRPVVRVAYSSRAMLLRLVRGARALLCPSLSEGFGLPALEAMTLGCPVVAARAGALPETCGDAALYVDPYDAASIARALLAVATDDALRARLAGEGKRQAGTFSMAAYQRRLEAGYRAAIARARTRRERR